MHTIYGGGRGGNSEMRFTDLKVLENNDETIELLLLTTPIVDLILQNTVRHLKTVEYPCKCF